MRTNIDIDDELLAKAMQAGPYTTKKDTVEAGLRMLARQAAYREILKWEGKLRWEGDESIDWTKPVADIEAEAAVAPAPAQHRVQEPPASHGTNGARTRAATAAAAASATAKKQTKPQDSRRAGR
ncbi:type II toxin-antitoxin system VapB family antitoxin [Ottowia sp.]|uniref:type II toxin-antitoxin system VapB family antitoxin n=1 Tax=Ottowia sp. TaxID=1898956 RepID=UPI00395EF639|nr:type II toxin-antitoxin system VapB family antitoxin [Pseudomonadota bacterium]